MGFKFKFGPIYIFDLKFKIMRIPKKELQELLEKYSFK